MVTLHAEKRDMTVKAKALRRQGKVIGSISGKDLPSSLSIQINEAEAKQFLKEHSKGSQAIIHLGDEKINVLLKDVSYEPIKHQYDNVEFQALVAGETVTGTAQIVLLNTDKVQGFLTHTLSEISYKAVPSALVEKIDIDMADIPVGSNVFVGDLDFAKNKDIELITPEDALILHIAEHQKGVAEEETDTETEEETAPIES